MKPLKAILSLVLVIFLAAQADAQLRKIPAPVTEAFKAKYDSAVNVEWKDRITSYSAVFEMDGKKHEAYFDDDGSWKHTVITIEESEIPAEVSEGLDKSKYSEWEFDKAEKIERDGGTDYRVIVKKSDIRKKSLLFGSDGKLKKDNYKL